MSGRYSRNKGKRGEQEACRLLRTRFPEVRSKRAGGETTTIDRGRDLLGTPGYCVQVNLSQRPPIARKFKEAERVALPCEVPVALTREDNGPWLVTMPASTWLALMARYEQGAVGVPPVALEDITIFDGDAKP